MKTCTKCGISKEPSEFHKNAVAPDGLRTSCKVCTNAYLRAYKRPLKPWRTSVLRQRILGLTKKEKIDQIAMHILMRLKIRPMQLGQLAKNFGWHQTAAYQNATNMGKALNKLSDASCITVKGKVATITDTGIMHLETLKQTLEPLVEEKKEEPKEVRHFAGGPRLAYKTLLDEAWEKSKDLERPQADPWTYFRRNKNVLEMKFKENGETIFITRTNG